MSNAAPSATPESTSGPSLRGPDSRPPDAERSESYEAGPHDSEPYEPHETPEPPVDWRDRVADVADDAKVWVAAHPLAALGIAVASGFVVGRMVRR